MCQWSLCLSSYHYAVSLVQTSDDAGDEKSPSVTSAETCVETELACHRLGLPLHTNKVTPVVHQLWFISVISKTLTHISKISVYSCVALYFMHITLYEHFTLYMVCNQVIRSLDNKADDKLHHHNY